METKSFGGLRLSVWVILTAAKDLCQKPADCNGGSSQGSE